MITPRNESETSSDGGPHESTKRTRTDRGSLSRRRLLHLTTLGLAGVVGASSRAGARSSSNTLTIEGIGPRADYRLTVGGNLQKSRANGASIGGSDEISGNSVVGWVGGGVDSYTFDGSIVSLALDGDARIELNGRRIDPAVYPDHVLTIEGAGPRTDYSFTVETNLEKSTANGASIGGSDDVFGNSVVGWVGGGADSYTFDGDIEAFSLDGQAEVTLDGGPAHVGQRPDHVITINGTGPRADYSFTVGGNLEKSRANGASIGGSDEISGNSVVGWVGGGVDSYTFDGDIEAFSLDGQANVTLDGGPAHVGQRPDNVITFWGTDSRTDYTLTVEANLEKSRANGASIGGSDEISGNSVVGWVGGGVDSYTFDGSIVSLDVDGDARIERNGRRIDANQSPLLGIYSGLSDEDFATVGRMEEWQGAPYAVQNLFVPWNPKEGHLNWLFDRVLPRIWQNGRVPLITWEPFTPGARSASVDDQALAERGEYDTYVQGLASTTPDDIEVRIKNGEYDAYIDRWARRLKGWLAGPDGKLGTGDDRRAYVRLGHEMNGDWYPWAPAKGENSPSDYIGMWRRVRRRVRRMGIDDEHVQWMWCVNADDVGPYTAEQLYPGDAHVDWVAFTGYNWGEAAGWSRWESPESVYGNMLGRLRDLADKPLCVAEVGSTSRTRSGHDPRRKGEWIRDAFAYFEDQDVEMWCWFNEDKETDWAVFDGVRGTETVAHDGERVDAYRAFRESVDGYTIGANTTATGALATTAFAGER